MLGISFSSVDDYRTQKKYFRSLPTEKVQFMGMEMSQTYKRLALVTFEKPILVVDRFHYA